jgi:hypothetical protein
MWQIFIEMGASFSAQLAVRLWSSSCLGPFALSLCQEIFQFYCCSGKCPSLTHIRSPQDPVFVALVWSPGHVTCCWSPYIFCLWGSPNHELVLSFHHRTHVNPSLFLPLIPMYTAYPTHLNFSVAMTLVMSISSLQIWLFWTRSPFLRVPLCL